MSKERALRRAAREAEQLRVREKHERSQARRAKRRRIGARVRALRPGRTGRLAKHTRGQRAILATVLLMGLLLIWTLVGSVALSIALTLLLVLALPVLAVIAFDK
ncbi:hypothetical protein [Hamadaea tsunoensis]|uniref:hypothetical protein n=1 Tax=Hamadaea tsunoensis TaxID=53368 RepID=UPI0003F61260|nr:hypothetical protein [Hamadaea tsunoensis]